MHQGLRTSAAPASASDKGLSPASTDLRSARALVIDANPTNRSILKGMLVDLGVKAEHVKQVGRFDEARTTLEYASFDIVLCDYHFQDTDQNGADLLDELRRSHSLPYATVFIMVTSEADHGRVAEAAESALDSYLLKPHNHNALAQRLVASRHRNREHRGQCGNAPRPARRSGTHAGRARCADDRPQALSRPVRGLRGR